MKILIIRVSAIGDVIHTLPAIFLIKKALPSARISWIVQKKSAALVKNQPFLDNVWIVSDRFLQPQNLSDTYRVLKQAYATQWDAIIDFQGLLKTSMLLMPFKGKKYGFNWHHAREKLSSLFTHHHTTPLYRNIIQKNLALASDVIYHISKSPSCPDIGTLKESFYLHTPNNTRSIVDDWLASNTIHKFITLCPNTTWKSKLWPVSHWLGLIKKIKAQLPGYAIILIGKDFGADAKKLAELLEHEKISVHIAPSWDLLATSYLITRANLLIAPDTSFLHIADFMGSNAIGIFGPTSKDKHGPFFQASNIKNVLQISCPHYYQKSHRGMDCMTQLTPDMLFEKVQGMLTIS